MKIDDVKKALKEIETSNKLVSDIVFEYLFDNIISLEYEPGSNLNETSLAEELGVSRTPVQKAIDKLTSMSLVKKISQKKTIIMPVSYEGCKEIYNFRVALEGEAAYWAAKNITSRNLEEFKAILADMKECISRCEYPVYQDHEFHEKIIYLSKNKYFIQAYDSYKYPLLRYRAFIKLNLPKESIDTYVDVYNTHLGIYNALKNRMASVARNEMIYDLHIMNDVLYLFK
ncbi:MAG: GntR family transcriptional regulator [Clostridiaceae bacterium]